MADYTQTLAQLLATNKQANAASINNPRVDQLGWANGQQNAGYGPVGEAFGKGVGDYVKETYVQAQKNRYMMENDPIEIEKRAEKFYQTYNNLDTAEQDKVDKWLNEDPQGLKWLDKLNKHASWMMTKVPLGEGQILKPGQANDDVQIYRPLRTLDSAEKMKNKALAAMPEAQRNPLLMSAENKDMAQAANLKSETEMRPRIVAADESRAAADSLHAKTAASIAPSQIAQNRAQAGYYNRMPTARQDPVGTKLKLQAYVDRNNEIKLTNDALRVTLAQNKVMPTDTAATRANKEAANTRATIEAATKIAAIDPLNGLALGSFRSAYSSIYGRRDKGEAAKDNAWLAATLLNSWGKQISTQQSYRDYFIATQKLMTKYWKEFYPEAKSFKEAETLINTHLKKIADPAIAQKVKTEEAYYRAQEKEMQGATLSISEYGGAQ